MAYKQSLVIQQCVGPDWWNQIERPNVTGLSDWSKMTYYAKNRISSKNVVGRELRQSLAEQRLKEQEGWTMCGMKLPWGDAIK